MKELVEVIAKALVDNPSEVVVTEKRDGKNIVVELRVAQSDMGKVIGKQGSEIEKLRKEKEEQAKNNNKFIGKINDIIKTLRGKISDIEKSIKEKQAELATLKDRRKKKEAAESLNPLITEFKNSLAKVKAQIEEAGLELIQLGVSIETAQEVITDKDVLDVLKEKNKEKTDLESRNELAKSQADEMKIGYAQKDKDYDTRINSELKLKELLEEGDEMLIAHIKQGFKKRGLAAKSLVSKQ